MAPRPFTGVFTQQEPISEPAIAAAVAVLKSGRLHRYNTIGEERSETAELEAEFAAYQGSRFCLACASGGYALQIALRAAGLEAGEAVLTNAFTLSPVPGAIAAAGGHSVLVETTPNLVIDLDDLERKADKSGARFLLLSHMRGHLADMARLTDMLSSRGAILVEDCAHTMGASWDGAKSGSFGLAGCFSTQTYKHLNSGEGGLLTSDDPDFMARAILLSGSYMLYAGHGAAPDKSSFEQMRLETPNMSGRMDNLRATILRPQLRELYGNVDRWNRRYRIVESLLSASGHFTLPLRPSQEHFVGSSIQFLVDGIKDSEARSFVAANRALGVELKWFGDSNPVGYTSSHHSWRYVEPQLLPRTDAILAALFDMRLPLSFSEADCGDIAAIIVHCARDLALRGAA